MKKRKPVKTQDEKRDDGLPVVVSARYPPALLKSIDDARGETPRQTWLLEAARQRLERDDHQRRTSALAEEHLELLRAGVPESDPRQVALKERWSALEHSKRTERLSEEAAARARKWFGGDDGGSSDQ